MPVSRSKYQIFFARVCIDNDKQSEDYEPGDLSTYRATIF